ncbi:ABC transporter substrate-binding protein [Schlesneria paludicola]|uniref:ABC transporter substrate-binding protein n=1 Tax=Schlesneria paludicola TaxID=360056 RepID=UPI00029AA2B7|nr:ABC transporter substrate-binding protein [Schlesneria paludicola]
MTCCRHWLGLLLLIAIGCQPESDSPKTPMTKDKALVPVTLALNWYPEAEHGGFYAALVHGDFAEEGLMVTIRPGGPNVPVIPDVASGKIEFGVDNADKLLLVRAQQADVVSVMSPLQNSPRCIMVHKKSGLTKIEELASAKPFTLAMNQGQPFAQYLMKKLNLDNIQVVPFPGGIAQFMDDPNYGQQAYNFSEPFLAEKQGGDPHCLMLSDFGFNAYTSVLLTRRELIDQQPDLVAKMTRASIKGWKKYLSAPEETNKYIHEQNEGMGLEILAFGVQALRTVCLPDGFDENRLGEMTGERWQTLVAQMIEIGSIKPDSVKADDAFSLKFLTAK